VLVTMRLLPPFPLADPPMLRVCVPLDPPMLRLCVPAAAPDCDSCWN